MPALRHIGSVAIAAVFTLALAIDAADARRGGGGGGGGGMRGGGFHGGGRVGMAGGAGRAHVSNPIARPGRGGNWANRPGGGGNWANRPGGPGWNNPGWANRPGYGWGAAAVGAGVAYGAASAYGNGYYDGGYYEEPTYSYQVAAEPGSDAIAECARRFKTYDPATQTYIRSKGVRASCP